MLRDEQDAVSQFNRHTSGPVTHCTLTGTSAVRPTCRDWLQEMHHWQRDCSATSTWVPAAILLSASQADCLAARVLLLLRLVFDSYKHTQMKQNKGMKSSVLPYSHASVTNRTSIHYSA
jgi:hypothetical protein